MTLTELLALADASVKAQADYRANGFKSADWQRCVGASFALMEWAKQNAPVVAALVRVAMEAKDDSEPNPRVVKAIAALDAALGGES